MDELTNVRLSSKSYGLIPFIKPVTERHVHNGTAQFSRYIKCHLSNSWCAPCLGRWNKPSLVLILVLYNGIFCGNSIDYSDSPNSRCKLKEVNISALYSFFLEHNTHLLNYWLQGVRFGCTGHKFLDTLQDHVYTWICMVLSPGCELRPTTSNAQISWFLMPSMSNQTWPQVLILP